MCAFEQSILVCRGRDGEAGDCPGPGAIDPRIRGTVNGNPCTGSVRVDQFPARAGNSGRLRTAGSLRAINPRRRGIAVAFSAAFVMWFDQSPRTGSARHRAPAFATWPHDLSPARQGEAFRGLNEPRAFTEQSPARRGSNRPAIRVFVVRSIPARRAAIKGSRDRILAADRSLHARRECARVVRWVLSMPARMRHAVCSYTFTWHGGLTHSRYPRVVPSRRTPCPDNLRSRRGGPVGLL